MVWVVVGLVVAGLLLVAEPVVRHRGVQEAADRLAMALDAEVELHVVGRPLLWHLSLRELPHVVVVAHDLPVLDGRACIDRLRVELDTVRLVGRGDHRRMTARAGRFHLTVTTGQLLRVVTLPSYLVGLEVAPTGLRLQTMAGVVVDATVRLDGDGLLVRPVSSMLRLLPQPSFRLPLPAWPYGASVRGVTLQTGEVEAWGVLDPAELTFPAVIPWGRPAA